MTAVGKSFHVAIHAPAQSLTQPLAVCFEAAFEQLAQLPRMFIEPDGSFVWVAEVGEQPWQIDGMLFDRGGTLQYVELRGNCTPTSFDRLLSIFRPPGTSVAIQLLQQAIFLDETEFRKYVWEETANGR